MLIFPFGREYALFEVSLCVSAGYKWYRDGTIGGPPRNSDAPCLVSGIFIRNKWYKLKTGSTTSSRRKSSWRGYF